jgi:hypothetical protein
MAADVKVREIRLLEAYSQRYQGFMESSIAMSYWFRAIITQKDDEARDYTRKISDHVNIIEQKLTHAKNDLEASARRGGGMDGKEMELRAQKVERWKKLLEKAKQYEEISKKLNQNVHAEVERMIWHNNRFRERLEKSRDDGMNFLNKAITALNSYTK